MPVTVKCPNPECQQKYQVPETGLGGRATCKKCGQNFTLEMSADETAVARPGEPNQPIVAGPSMLVQREPTPTQQAPAAKRPVQKKEPSQPDPSLPREKIGPYILKRKLGEGGMGQVWLAYDPNLQRDVALKTLRPEYARDQTYLKRFLREARAAAQLHHQNTVTIYQVAAEGDLVYIAMEMVDGGSLDDAVEEGKPLEWREATRAIRDAASGLAAAHKLGLIHRDVKPANMMRTSDGVTKLVDFGLARASQQMSQLTRQGALMGTPAYMSPEQWRGEEADARSDLYSLVCSYYQLLTGETPYQAPAISALGYLHNHQPFPDPRRLAPNLPQEVCRILAKGASKEPDRRYQSAAELAAELNALLAAPLVGMAVATPWSDLVGPAPATPAGQPNAQGSALTTLASQPPPPLGTMVVPPPLQRKSPPWYRRPGNLIMAAAAGAAFVVLAVILYIQTNYGTVKIDLSDAAAQVEVTIDGDRIDLKGLKEPLRIEAREHELKVTGGDYETFARQFTVRRGQTELVTVTLVPKAKPEKVAGPEPKPVPPKPVEKADLKPPPEAIQPMEPEKKPVAVAVKPEVSVPTTDSWTDLMPRMDLNRDKVAGEWKQANEAITVTPSKDACLMLPVILEGSYDIEVEFTRDFGAENVSVYFPIGWQHMYASLGSASNQGSAFGMIGCWGAKGNNPSHRDSTLTNEKRYTVQINVRVMGSRVSLQALLDGAPHLQWQGERGAVGLHDSVALLGLRRPALGADDSAVTFHSARLRLVSNTTCEPGKLRLLSPGESCEEPFIATERYGGKGVVFHDLAPGNGYLVGFRVYRSQVGSLHAIQPIYHTSAGSVDGVLHGGDWSSDGVPTGLGQPTEIVAKEGYAVGAISLAHISEKRPKGLSGMRITFMRVSGRKLEQDAYQSQWIGTAKEEAKLDSKEKLATGIHGAFAGGIVSLGLLLAEPPDKLSSANTGSVLPGAAVPQGHAPNLSPPPPPAVAPFDEKKAKEHQQNWAKHLGVPVEMTNSIGMKFVLIPPGEFMMGNGHTPDEEIAAFRPYTTRFGRDAFEDEYPRHRVLITRPFFLGMHEVTFGQFDQFVRATSHKTEAEIEGKELWGYDGDTYVKKPGSSWRNAGFHQTHDHPVMYVGWKDSMAFCEWLSRNEGKTYRLPTEAEWEYACRAGTTTRYYNSDDPEKLLDVGNVSDSTPGRRGRDAIRGSDGYAFTAPVGQFRANCFRLYDMHGNIGELCADWYDPAYYATAPRDDPLGPSIGTRHVVRGGAFNLGPPKAGTGHRAQSSPLSSPHQGFRVCLMIAPAATVGSSSATSASEFKAVGGTPKAAKETPSAVRSPPSALPGAPPPLAVAPFDEKKAKEHQQNWAKYLGVPVEMTNSIGMKFVLIPPGEFTMGSPVSEMEHRDDEGEHRVHITRPFYFGVHEVTQREYQQVMGSNPSYFSSSGAGKDQIPGQDTGRFPVEQVTWDEAGQFCYRLSQKEGRRYSLPTEHEWEYACRAGTTTPFHFGSVLNGSQANICGKAPYGTDEKGPFLNRTTTVGSYPPNGFGLLDMHGNVIEQCAAGYVSRDEGKSPTNDPKGSTSGSKHPGRGGAWNSRARICRSASRGSHEPEFRADFLGFRVLAIVEPANSKIDGGQAGDKGSDIAKTEPPIVNAQPSAPPLAVAPFDEKKAKEHQAAWAKYLGVPVEMTNSIGMKFVLIPPGEFMMGSPESEPNAQPNEKPQHPVRITQPLFLGMYEVTQSEYLRVMGNNPSDFCAKQMQASSLAEPPSRKESELREAVAKTLAGKDTTCCPIEMVSWDQATEFCHRLSLMPTEKVAGHGYRLPMEAEWECACRAGTTTPFSFGSSLNGTQANTNGNEPYGTTVKGPYLERTTRVGSYQPNAFGLYDMHGNVWEWCADWYEKKYYWNWPQTDPPGPSSGSNRVIRGGSWSDLASDCRSANRINYGPPNRVKSNVGFRVCLTIAEK